jgi:hypothetical protein
MYKKFVYKVVHCTDNPKVFESIWAGSYKGNSFISDYHNYPITYIIGSKSVADPRCSDNIWCFESLKGAKEAYILTHFYDRKGGKSAILKCEAIGEVKTHYNHTDECFATKIMPLSVMCRF